MMFQPLIAVAFSYLCVHVRSAFVCECECVGACAGVDCRSSRFLSPQHMQHQIKLARKSYFVLRFICLHKQAPYIHKDDKLLAM